MLVVCAHFSVGQAYACECAGRKEIVCLQAGKLIRLAVNCDCSF